MQAGSRTGHDRRPASGEGGSDKAAPLSAEPTGLSVGVGPGVDIHCHCLPGLDDGPKTVSESLDLGRALVRDRVTHVFATPHQLGPYGLRHGGAVVRQAVHELQQALASAGVALRVLPGGDVRVDERLLDLLDQDQVLTLGDTGRYILLELPHEGWVDPVLLMAELSGRGITPILTHPERNHRIMRSEGLVKPMLEVGAVLQVTAGSLIGEFGGQAQASAWRLFERGWVSLIASDAHGLRQRAPRMSAAFNKLSRRYGHTVAKQVCLDNPRRVLETVRAGTPRHPLGVGATETVHESGHTQRVEASKPVSVNGVTDRATRPGVPAV